MACTDTVMRASWPEVSLRFTAALADDVHVSWWPAGIVGLARLAASARVRAQIGQTLAREHGLDAAWPRLAQPARRMWLLPGALLQRLAFDIGLCACRDRIRHAVTPGERERWAPLGRQALHFVHGARAQNLAAALSHAVRTPLSQLGEHTAPDVHGCTAVGAGILLAALRGSGASIGEDMLSRRSRLIFAREPDLPEVGDVEAEAVAALAIGHLVEVEPTCRWLLS